MPCYFNPHNPHWWMCSNYQNALRWTWWRNRPITFGFGFTLGPMSLVGVAKMVYWTPLFFIKTLVILSIQLVTMFCLVATLWESDGTLDVVVRFEDIFVATIVCSLTKFWGCKVHLEIWHVAMAKCHGLLT
jgi:hypothetical protein